MSLVIQSNLEAFDAHRNLVNVEDQITKSMQRLSSGYRINSAADDAAGLSISQRMQGQMAGLAQAQRNMGDGISLIQTADGALDAVHQMLQRVRELAVEYKNGTLSSTDQTAIQSEVNQLASEIERIGASTQFNGISLLNTGSNTITFQVGANDGNQIAVTLFSLGSSSGVGTNYYTLTTSGSTDISEIDAAINNVSALRSTLGAVQNRLQYASDNAAVYEENLTAANSRIQDVDMAQETVTLTKNQILAQAGQAMLAQANQAGQGVLQLLH